MVDYGDEQIVKLLNEYKRGFKPYYIVLRKVLKNEK